MPKVKPLALGLAVLFCSLANAAPIGVDGAIGAEWGAPTSTVAYDPLAAQNNFGTPGTANHNVGYSIYMRSDGNYLYGAVAASGPINSLSFANIYLNVDGISNPNGSDLGLEVTNDRFFRPGLAGYQNDTQNLLAFAVSASGNVIEFALDWDMLLNDPYLMGYPTATQGGKVIMNLSQSFGYSVAGGQANYGNNRLGAVDVPSAVPEPGVLALAGMALFSLALTRRRG